MMKELKNRFRSIYWQQFSLIAGIVLLTLLLLIQLYWKVLAEMTSLLNS